MLPGSRANVGAPGLRTSSVVPPGALTTSCSATITPDLSTTVKRKENAPACPERAAAGTWTYAWFTRASRRNPCRLPLGGASDLAPAVDDVATAKANRIATPMREIRSTGDKSLALESTLRNPHLRGTVFDLESALAEATARLAQAGVRDRCDLVAGNFFEEVTVGKDAYVLSHVLHDWDDDRARHILERVRAAVPRNCRVLTVPEADRVVAAPPTAPAVSGDGSRSRV